MTSPSSPLADLSRIRELLRRHDYRPSRTLGQNFLRDGRILEEIIAVAEPGGREVIEIGPGLGVLTAALAEKARRVVAVEVARRLEPLLRETLAGYSNVELIFEDFLRLPAARLGAGPLLAVANLPYSVTTPVLFRFLDGEIPWTRMVFMVQLEVAERLTAAPSTKEYGALTISAQASSSIRIVKTVPSRSFFPPPRVASAVVVFEPRGGNRPEGLRELLASAFSSRRKTLRNALKKTPGAGECAEKLGINLDLRPENISVEEWLALAELQQLQ